MAAADNVPLQLLHGALAIVCLGYQRQFAGQWRAKVTFTDTDFVRGAEYNYVVCQGPNQASIRNQNQQIYIDEVETGRRVVKRSFETTLRFFEALMSRKVFVNLDIYEYDVQGNVVRLVLHVYDYRFYNHSRLQRNVATTLIASGFRRRLAQREAARHRQYRQVLEELVHAPPRGRSFRGGVMYHQARVNFERLRNNAINNMNINN